MRASIGLMMMIALLICGGCNSQARQPQGPLHGVSANQAAEMDAQRNVFEVSEDPPFTADTRFAAGQLAESQGVVPQAIIQYSEAIKVDPKHQNSLYRLGVLYAQTKQYPQAVDAWEQYVKATKGSPVAYSNLGFCHEVAGDKVKAEQAYRQGIARDSKNVPCRVNFGLMLARAGREPEAMDQLQAVLTPAEAHYNLGSVYEQQGRKDQARAHYNKALELNPAFLDAQTRLAQMK